MRAKVALIVLGVVVVVGLALFFYPKDCGRWSVVPGADRQSCRCLGFKQNIAETTDVEGAGGYDCYGLVLSE